jgi:hypothetical protein
VQALEFYPFRPALEGAFLARFYQRMERLLDDGAEDFSQRFERAAEEEYLWATHGIAINPDQRLKYRAVWMLLRDLVRVRWELRLQNGVLEIASPQTRSIARSVEEMKRIKRVGRQMMSEVRRDKIIEAEKFIRYMESPPASSGARVPISALIADGKELSRQLRQIANVPDVGTRSQALKQVIDPYLQLVTDDRCELTGFKLGDIWRYFRYTWSTPAELTPGRSLLYLVRDRARQYHPVMGIAALENAPIRITDRDTALGWSFESIKQQIEETEHSFGDVRHIFKRLLRIVNAAISEIDLDGLCTVDECESPDEELFSRLEEIATISLHEKERALKVWHNRDGVDVPSTEPLEKSDMGNISRDAERALYRRKRAITLSRLLRAKRELSLLLGSQRFDDMYKKFLNSDKGRSAIGAALMAAKSRHIGTSLLELNVCGAIPPYNEVLSGKLVALLMLSPTVVRDYKLRYQDRESDIASKLKGEKVVRPAELVFIGTTSLYNVGSSQYNRLRLPKGLLGAESSEVRWERLGDTGGYGTLHISRLTLQCLEDVLNKEYRRVNHVFGEGASPKLRKVRSALAELLEPGQNPTIQAISRHEMRRIVFGAWLAKNGRQYLSGEASEPVYYFEGCMSPDLGTQRIIDYWRDRWLTMRLDHEEALKRMANFSRDSVLVGKELEQVESQVRYVDLKGAKEVGGLPHPSSQSVTFVKSLYRGTSAYADQADLRMLSLMHIPTRLDIEVISALKSGKSVVLTGNPGDGKTHLLRVLQIDIQSIEPSPVVELDASERTDEELFQLWSQAHQDGRPFCVAINQAVLHNLAQRYSDFLPLQEAWRQVENAEYYETPEEDARSSCVVVFDLSRRNVLANDIVRAVIERLTDERFLDSCMSCPHDDCDVKRNRRAMRTGRFQQRLQLLLDKVSMRGYHATIRELKAFVSYLLFAGRDCARILNESGHWAYSLAQLPFSGEGGLFKVLRETLDPFNVSHPVWDELLVAGKTDPEDWLPEWPYETGSIDVHNEDRFRARKRAFYFFHSQGEVLVGLAADDESDFASFMEMQDREALRFITSRINHFFGDERSKDYLRIWQSHRYDQSSRRVLYSGAVIHRSEFRILRPKLAPIMSQAFSPRNDHVLLYHPKHHARLKIDFPMFAVLAKAYRGVPALSLDGAETRRLCMFMEQLSQGDGLDEAEVVILDPSDKSQLTVVVDRIEGKYLDVQWKGV